MGGPEAEAARVTVFLEIACLDCGEPVSVLIDEGQDIDTRSALGCDCECGMVVLSVGPGAVPDLGVVEVAIVEDGQPVGPVAVAVEPGPSLWRPVSDPPDTGDDVLVWCADGLEGCAVADYSPHPSGPRWRTVSGGPCINPSHWMPLPDPPGIGR